MSRKGNPERGAQRKEGKEGAEDVRRQEASGWLLGSEFLRSSRGISTWNTCF